MTKINVNCDANDVSTLAVHVHDVVTDWSYALAGFLVPHFFAFCSHCKCFSIRIPFLFQYRSIIFYVQVEHQEAVEEAVEFQDRTGVLLLLLCSTVNNVEF